MRPTPAVLNLLLLLNLGLAGTAGAAAGSTLEAANGSQPGEEGREPRTAEIMPPAADTAKFPHGAPAPAAVPEAASAPAAAAPGAAAPTDSLAAAAGAASAKTDTVMKVVEPALVEAPGLAKLEIGGTFQLKGFYQDFAADEDADKRAGFELRRARVDLNGAVGDRFFFEGQFLLEGNGRQLGTEAVYLAWKLNDFFGIKGGKLKRPFSQEALSSSKALYTVERSVLYHDFLATTTGYSFYDLGLVFHGGFVDEDVPVTYEAGVFNGKQSENSATGYAGQHYETRDAGFKAKDFAMRLQVQPFRPLKVEAALSTKAAEDRSDPATFDYQVNTAYEAGIDFRLDPLRVLGEIAWGDNHQGVDAGILSGSTNFLSFYAMAVWHEDYSRGRASELVLRLEGLDPASGEEHANDAKLRYTVGANYFFTKKVSVLADYTLLQPFSKLPGGDELVNGLEAMWRMSF